MRSKNHIRSFIIMAVVFLLFSSLITRAVYAGTMPRTVCAALVSKKHNSHLQPGIETPYEEREKEEEDNAANKSHRVLFIICHVSHSLQPASLSALYSLHTASRSCGHAFGVPMFLAKRTLLI